MRFWFILWERDVATLYGRCATTTTTLSVVSSVLHALELYAGEVADDLGNEGKFTIARRLRCRARAKFWLIGEHEVDKPSVRVRTRIWVMARTINVVFILWLLWYRYAILYKVLFIFMKKLCCVLNVNIIIYLFLLKYSHCFHGSLIYMQEWIDNISAELIAAIKYLNFIILFCHYSIVITIQFFRIL